MTASQDTKRARYMKPQVLLAPISKPKPWLMRQGKDLKWWSTKRDGEDDEARVQTEMEKARLKQLDEDLLNEALGLAPRKVRGQHEGLSAADRNKLLEKGAGAGEGGVDTERVSGLGAGPTKHHDHIPTLSLKERELERLKREHEMKESGLADASLVEIVDYEKEQREKAEALARKTGNGGKAGPDASRKRSREEKRVRKREKEAKRQKKKEKKEKKRLKQAKGHGHHRPIGVDQEVGKREADSSLDIEADTTRGRESPSTHARVRTKEVVSSRRKEANTHRDVAYPRQRDVASDRTNGDHSKYEQDRRRSRDIKGGVASDGGRGRTGDRGALYSNRPRSRSPLESRKVERSGRWDSRDRHRRHPEVSRGSGDSRGAQGSYRRQDDLKERRATARQTRSASDSSSSSSSGDSSDGGNTARTAPGQYRNVSAARRGTRESSRGGREEISRARQVRSTSRSSSRGREKERDGGGDGTRRFGDGGRRHDRQDWRGRG